ncbi:MAG: DLW-39 family protein [Actinomycetota bacterium]|nr:DLW-39 family protein [Actinomycetota bacterium]
MKKLLVLGIIVGVGYFAYKQYLAKQDEADLWSEPTQEPDLR